MSVGKPHSEIEVFVVGRFPPPVDGQTLATERIASFLDGRFRVERLNTQAPGEQRVRTDARPDFRRVFHYTRKRRELCSALASNDTAPVLWNSLSPTFLGHWRDMLLTLPAFAPGQPVFAVMHRATFDRRFNSVATAMTARAIVQRMHGFVFLTRSLADQCAPWIPEHKRIIIPNTVDDEVLVSRKEVQSKIAGAKSRKTFRVLFVSNMLLEKGYLDVIRAAGILTRQGVNLQVHFAGGWTSASGEREFHDVVASERLVNHVIHHGGTLSRPDIKRLHLDADAFVLPSYHPTETLPKAILEALSAGTPVVASRQGGIPEMIDDGVEGFIVSARCPQEIADAIQRLMDYDRWIKMSKAARARFDEKYHPEVVREQWIELVGSIR